MGMLLGLTLTELWQGLVRQQIQQLVHNDGRAATGQKLHPPPRVSVTKLRAKILLKWRDQVSESLHEI